MPKMAYPATEDLKKRETNYAIIRFTTGLRIGSDNLSKYFYHTIFSQGLVIRNLFWARGRFGFHIKAVWLQTGNSALGRDICAALHSCIPGSIVIMTCCSKSPLQLLFLSSGTVPRPTIREIGW